jgi:hypothetical protein
MKPILKFLLLVVLLNLARYLLGWLPESWWVIPGMFGVMEKFPESFNVNFNTEDFTFSVLYNFMLWLSAAWIFHVAHAGVHGNFLMKSLKIYGISCLFFVSLAAVFMNHFVDSIKPFYLYSILDAVILFPIVALANGLLYPKLFKAEIAH